MLKRTGVLQRTIRTTPICQEYAHHFGLNHSLTEGLTRRRNPARNSAGGTTRTPSQCPPRHPRILISVSTSAPNRSGRCGFLGFNVRISAPRQRAIVKLDRAGETRIRPRELRRRGGVTPPHRHTAAPGLGPSPLGPRARSASGPPGPPGAGWWDG